MTYSDITIDLRGRKTRLLRGGAGAPLIYLHDTFIVDEIWRDLHEQLASHYDVIIPFHPGCEGSESGEIDTVDDLLFHYLDLCEALQLDRPLLLGVSLGGWIAAEWAVRYSHMLRGLILVNALGLRIPDVPAADILRLDSVQTRDHLFANPDGQLAHQIIPDIPSEDHLSALLKSRQTLARFAWQFPDNPKLSRYLYRVTLPTLVIWGQQDDFIPSAHGQAYHEAIADSELALLPGCGHLPHIEQSEAFTHTLMDFINRHGLLEGTLV